MKTDITLKAEVIVSGEVTVPLDTETFLDKTIKEYIVEKLNSLCQRDRTLDIEGIGEGLIGNFSITFDISSIRLENFK